MPAEELYTFTAADLAMNAPVPLTESDTVWTAIDVDRPMVFQCTDWFVQVRYRPSVPGAASPANGGSYVLSRLGTCMFGAPGRWWVQARITVTGSPAARTFFLIDARVFMGGFGLDQAFGTANPGSTPAAPTSVAVTAASGAFLSADATRKRIYVKSRGGVVSFNLTGGTAVIQDGLTLINNESAIIELEDGAANAITAVGDGSFDVAVQVWTG